MWCLGVLRMSSPHAAADALITEAYRRSGKRNVDAAAVERARDNWLFEVVDDVLLQANEKGDAHLRSLHTTAVSVGKVNQRRYALPSDFSHELEVWLMEGDHTDTATGGNVSSATLAADEDISVADAEGAYYLGLTGASTGQYRQITDYDSDTVTVTVESAWDDTKQPLSGDTYRIVDFWAEVDRDSTLNIQGSVSVRVPGRPRGFGVFGGEFYLDRPLEAAYGLMLRYYADPRKAELTDSVWTTILAEWNGVFTKGMYVMALSDIDDNRVDKERIAYRLAIAGLINRELDAGREFEGFEI